MIDKESTNNEGEKVKIEISNENEEVKVKDVEETNKAIVF